MTAVSLLLAALGCILLMPVAVLLIQVLAAFLPYRQWHDAMTRPRIAVLVPAHNESAVIADTLRTITPQLAAGDRLLVVADNCTDDTASIATQCGAEVVERSNLAQRGKGFALDFGVRHLAGTQAPEVLIIVDADCVIGENCLEVLARRCLQSGRPVQALYLMHAPTGAGVRMQLAEFAWMVKNLVRPLGAANLGLPCQLMGTGMAFPWVLASGAKLANASIVEDMQLGIDLALVGSPPFFCPDVRVSSVFPESSGAEQSQRTRWEHGHLAMILQGFPTLLGRGLLRFDAKLLGMGLDLVVPPLALLVLSLLVFLGLAGALVLAGASVLPFCLAVSAISLLGAAIMLAWLGWGRRVVAFSTLLTVPFYILAKIPVYLKFLVKRQQEWVRTDRK